MNDEKSFRMNDKKSFLKRRTSPSENVYLPNPGVSMDITLEDGDFVFIDVKHGHVYGSVKSLNINSEMSKLDKTWVMVKGVTSYNCYYNCACYLLEGNHYYWSWFHFGAVRKKNPHVEALKDLPRLPKL